MSHPIIPALVLASLTAPACGEDLAPSSPRRAGHVEVIRKRIAATNAKDFAAWEALHARGACRTAPELDAPLCGPAAVRAAIEVLATAFPDYQLALVDAFGEGDRLAVRMRSSDTHTGPLILSDGTAIPPTGLRISQDWIALVTFDGAGLIVQFDEFYDQLALLVQLGLAPRL